MKLRNKKTGEIGTLRVDYLELYVDTENGYTYNYKSLQKMYEEFEDYEEPKEDYIRVIDSFIDYVEKADESFECDESVLKFTEKLKAWRRLKNNGFRVLRKTVIGEYVNVSFILNYPVTNVEEKDLDLLFGGKE